MQKKNRKLCLFEGKISLANLVSNQKREYFFDFFQINLLVNFSLYFTCLVVVHICEHGKIFEMNLASTWRLKIYFFCVFFELWKWRGEFFVSYTWGSYINFYQKLWCRDIFKLAILCDDSIVHHVEMSFLFFVREPFNILGDFLLSFLTRWG